MKEKLYYIICGSIMTFAQLLLIDTRFNSLSIGFGLCAAYLYIRALMIRPRK